MPYRLATPLCLPVFPGCQILSVCRFSQRIIGAITSSTLEGLTSGLRITHPTIPLKRCSLAVSTENWCRRLDLNQRIPPGAVLCLLSYVCECPLWDTSSGNPGREVRGVLCPTGIAPGRQGQVPVAGDELLLRAAAYIFGEHWQRRITRNVPRHGADGWRCPQLPA